VKILDIRPAPPGSGNTVARFDIALDDDLKLFNLKLSTAHNGGYRVYAPSAFGSSAATFSQPLVAEITRAAIAAMESKPSDRNAD
jgi:hypothetical protein